MHWFYDPDANSGLRQLAKSELIHLRALRIAVDEPIAITNGMGFGVIARMINPASGECEVIGELSTQPKPRVHLFQAIAKGGRDEIALQACVEVGIASATAFEAERSVANWRGKEQKGLARWEQIAISATKQSQQLHLPTVHFAASATELRPIGLGIVLDPRAHKQLGEIPQSDQYSVVVGPEGGFSKSELETLTQNGFEPIRLGTSVLRTSTAGVVATACLQLIAGEYGGTIV